MKSVTANNHQASFARLKACLLALRVVLTLRAVLLLGVVMTSSPAVAQQTTTTAEVIRQHVTDAGQAFKKGDIEHAVSIINRSSELLKQLGLQATNPKSLDSLKSTHAALLKAHGFLSKKNAESLNAFPDWATFKKEIIEQLKSQTKSQPKSSADPKANGVDFLQEVAPWMVAKCGGCHVNGTKGGFSMATIASLVKGSKAGVVLFAGDSNSSRIVEVIRTGDMPRGGGKVTPDELAKLEQWIREGAQFDAKVSGMPLQQLISQKLSGSPVGVTPDMSAIAPAKIGMESKPTGKETVSFSRDVAPLLMANCNGCHVDAMQLRGGLNMNNFAMFSKGGDSGEIVVSKNSSESLIVQKLRGTSGQRMPAGGRPALSEENIQLVAKWIDEGAFFDGQSPNLSLAVINATAWAASASYEEVMERRRERALAKWKVAYGNQKPAEASDKNFVVLGNVSQAAVQEVLEAANQANDKVRKALKVSEDAELAKGGVTVFAIKGRYDYSEFGKMTESRTLPSSWSSHWRRDALDVYIAILYDSKDAKANEANLSQQLASVWISQFEETPSWFADGFGRGVLAIVGGKSDPHLREQIKIWDAQIATIVGNMKDPKELLEGKMNEEDAAIVGYALCRKMIDVNGRRQFSSLLQSLNKTQSFPQAFQSVVGPMEMSIAMALGLKLSK